MLVWLRLWTRSGRVAESSASSSGLRMGDEGAGDMVGETTREAAREGILAVTRAGGAGQPG